MYAKKLLSIGFIAMIVLSMATVSMADPWDTVVDDPTPAQALWVDPNDSGTFNMTDVFTVDVLVNVTDLYGFEYKLKWNSTWVECTDIQYHNPYSVANSMVVKNTTGVWGDGRLYHWLSISALSPEPAFNGVTSLATYKFEVKTQPTFPKPDYVGSLDIQEDKLTDSSAQLIPHTTTDGTYTLQSIEPPKPYMSLDPAYVVGVYGNTFTLDIVINQLFAARDLCGWEAKLSYNTTVLDCLASAEGPFLPGFAGPNGTSSVNNINDTIGVVHMGGLFLGTHTQPFGTGVVETLTFNATREYEVPTEGAPPFVFPMDLYDVKLVDCAVQEIDQDKPPEDGEYEAPYRTLGWSLDCWTDPYRKKCETPFIGIGPGMNADAYEPQELVTLYAYLSYNEYEVQDKIVSFSIYGPRNPYYNITIYRTAQTNASGVATINFTIPHPCEYVEEVVFGKWYCFQKAQVKFGEPNDTIWWTVGWIVELLDAEVDDEVRPCEDLNITIYYKNIMMISKFVLFTFTIYDELLDPIGDAVVGFQVPAGAWCHPAFDSISTKIHIPKWVHVGPGGTLYVNAFTALPVDCGCPYCPEISVTVNIVKP